MDRRHNNKTNTTCVFLWIHRSTWWEPSHSGVLPGRCDIRRNCCTEISVPNGRWRHRVRHCHYKTDQWNKLDQILDGKTGACPLLGSVARDSKGERPFVTQAHHPLVFWHDCLNFRETTVKEALLRPAHDAVTLIPLCTGVPTVCGTS